MSMKQQPKQRALLAHHIKPHKNNEGERGRAMSMKLNVTYISGSREVGWEQEGLGIEVADPWFQKELGCQVHCIEIHTVGQRALQNSHLLFGVLRCFVHIVRCFLAVFVCVFFFCVCIPHVYFVSVLVLSYLYSSPTVSFTCSLVLDFGGVRSSWLLHG